MGVVLIRRLVVAGVALGATLPLSAAALAANVFCQSQPVPGLGGDTASAGRNWAANVTKLYGSSWTDMRIAKDYSSSKTGEPPVYVVTVTAIPCRPAPFITGPIKKIPIPKPPAPGSGSRKFFSN